MHLDHQRWQRDGVGIRDRRQFIDVEGAVTLPPRTPLDMPVM